MIQVEGHWETINSLHDVSRVIRENYNHELARELDDLIDAKEDEIKRLVELVDELEWELDNFK